MRSFAYVLCPCCPFEMDTWYPNPEAQRIEVSDVAETRFHGARRPEARVYLDWTLGYQRTLVDLPSSVPRHRLQGARHHFDTAAVYQAFQRPSRAPQRREAIKAFAAMVAAFLGIEFSWATIAAILSLPIQFACDAAVPWPGRLPLPFWKLWIGVTLALFLVRGLWRRNGSRTDGDREINDRYKTRRT